MTCRLTLSKQTLLDPNGVEETIVMDVDGHQVLLNAEAALEVAGQLMFLAAVLNPQLVDEAMR